MFLWKEFDAFSAKKENEGKLFQIRDKTLDKIYNVKYEYMWHIGFKFHDLNTGKELNVSGYGIGAKNFQYRELDKERYPEYFL